MLETLRANLLAPIPLAFGLGLLARMVRSELALPKDLYTSLSIYLLLALGLKGGVELSHTSLATIAGPAAVTLLLGVVTPLIAYAVLRYLGRFDVANAAGIAAHYGSVSAVTFIAAQQFVERMGHPAEGFMPTLLVLLESPGIQIALAIGAISRARALAASAPKAGAQVASPLGTALHEILTGRTMILLVGGLVIGFLMGTTGWGAVSPFFDAGFKGALMLFILEMGIVAGSRLEDLKQVGPFLLGFGILVPLLHGVLGVLLGHASGLSVGGATVLGTMAASASYIAAPPAVRLTLPEANPTFSLTASLAITFPFNVVLGIPIYYQVSAAIA